MKGEEMVSRSQPVTESVPLSAREAVPSRGRSFLIAPVRGLLPDAWASIVSGLEGEGYSVHWPARDTDQGDPNGLRICSDNMAAIAAADVVHVIWDGNSYGCIFDLGMAFALGKRVVPLQLPPPTPGKSFQNMVRAWAT